MATIGKFTKEGDNYEGFIETRTWNNAVSFVKIDTKGKEKAPDYRVMIGRLEIGAAWQKTSEAKTAYLSVSIDDPTFPAPINCRLHESHEGFDLVWTRN
jgi:uncharacterized protein (DUF736 family)